MRKIMITLLMVMMLVLSGLSSAQDAMCGNLDEANCAFLTESNAAMMALNSADFDFNLTLTMSGMADGSDGSFILSGDGSFNGDMSGIDPTAMAASGMDISASIDMLKTVFTSFDGELNLGLAAPEQGLPEGMLSFELLLVDGIGYLNFESLGLLLGGPDALSAMGLPTGWGGLDLIDVIDQAVAMMGDLSELEGSMGDMGDQAAMQQAAMDMAMKYLQMERLADEGGLAVFQTTLDFGGMLADPAFLEMVQAQAEGQGQSITAEELAEASEMLAAMGEGLTMTIVSKINVDTKFVESTTFEMVLDAAVFAAAAGESGTGSLAVSGVFNASNFNSAAEIVAPAGAPVAKFMDLMMLAGSMGGGF